MNNPLKRFTVISLPKQPDHIFVRIAVMYNKRQTALLSGFDIFPKQSDLRFLRRKIIIIIQSGLTDGNHFFMTGRRQNIFCRQIGKLFGLMRMCARSGINAGICGGYLQMFFQMIKIAPGIKYYAHPGLPGAFHNTVKRFVIFQMAVTVNQHFYPTPDTPGIRLSSHSSLPAFYPD